jgi:aspartate/methionine/tyrosine aminotransferase
MERHRTFEWHEIQQNLIPEQRFSFLQAAQPATVDLSTAENILLLPFYDEHVFNNLPPVTSSTIRYPTRVGTSIYGPDEYRKGVAQLLQWEFGIQSLDYKTIYACSGVVAALELLALALFKPGDQILTPAPVWYGFPWSFAQNPRMNFETFHIDNETTLTAANVRTALEQNPNAKLLVLTNPNNPLGTNYPKAVLEEIYELWLSNADRHIISDEIYGGSQVGDQKAFVSALNLDAYKKYAQRIHVTWGLSKDFGLAGLRAGFIISQSTTVAAFMNNNNCTASGGWFSPFVTTNTYLTHRLFLNDAGNADPTLAKQAMNRYKDLLKQQYQAAAQALDAGGISYYPNNQGAIFFWIDLQRWLPLAPKNCAGEPTLCANLYSHDDANERGLARYLAENAVALVRGQECFNVKPGFFRLCYTAETLDDVTRGIAKMATALAELPNATCRETKP